ncbi:MAG: TldD/PmbA family protein [Alphaproteobacteria bacterium]|nr:TldD/PmbA family protein [Alphaproteobacteria bacterium]
MSTSSAPSESTDKLDYLIKKALKAGADAADAVLVDATALSVTWRDGKLESLESTETGDLGLRVFIGKQQAIVSTTDRRMNTLNELVDRAIAMVREAPADEFCGIASSDQISHQWPKLEMADDAKMTAETLIEQARTAEAAALAIPGVSQCESTDAGSSSSAITLVASNGFAGHYRRTGYSVSAAVLAGSGTEMERDYDYASTVFRSDMPDAAAIGREAAERAVKHLGSRKMPTARAPVVMEPRIASSMLGHLAGAISGASVARGTSFLKDKLGEKIFRDDIAVIDDPFRARGLRSKSFDGEGIAPKPLNIIDQGKLTTWLLDLRSARQLGMTSTGHGSRSAGSVPYPSPSNFYMSPGQLSPEDLIKDIKQGFYVTDLMGDGVNGVTGDYSRAASGFWIENGQISFPVNEMTIAGNLKDMFMNLYAANDLKFKDGIDAPTIRIDGMTIAGV